MVAVLFNLFIVLISYRLVENTRRIFGRAREGNLSSRRIFLAVLVGHKKTLSGPLLPTPALEQGAFLLLPSKIRIY
jgi:hypothetical protein